MDKKILFLSTFFPNPQATSIATYNRQILLALTDYYDIDAVVPIPWVKRFQLHTIPHERAQGAIKIYHPTYFYTPYIMRFMYGRYYYYSIIDTIKSLTETRQYDLIYSSWLYPDAWVAAIVAKELKIPLFVSVLGTDVNRLKQNSTLTNKSLDVANRAKKIICVCDVLKQKLVSLGCHPDKLVYLQNGVDHSIFFPRNKKEVRLELGIDLNNKLIVYVGNLKKEKGLSELAEAFSNIINKKIYYGIKLVVIGDGQFRHKLIKALKQNNTFENTMLLGQQSLNVISTWMNAADVLCLPSYTEGQPNVVIEALSCHTKVVATNVGGIPDLEDGRGNMKLVAPRSVVALTAALIEMIEKDSDFGSHSSIYSWNEYAVRLKNIFEQ